MVIVHLLSFNGTNTENTKQSSILNDPIDKREIYGINDWSFFS